MIPNDISHFDLPHQKHCNCRQITTSNYLKFMNTKNDNILEGKLADSIVVIALTCCQ